MVTKYAASHLQVSADAVKLDRFSVVVADRDHLNPDFVPDWDYFTDLRVSVDVDVDLGRCINDSGLRYDSILGVSVTWHATGSGLRGASDVLDVVGGQNSIQLDLPGAMLGGQLVLDVFLTAKFPQGFANPLAARRPGSILWTDRRTVRLEGDGSRFPMSPISFKESGIAGGLTAAWALIFDSTELYDSGLGSTRLYLNTDHPKVEALLNAPDVESETIARVLHADVNRAMVLQALGSEDLELEEDYPGESLGELLVLAMNRNFPDVSVEQVRAMLATRPGEFEAVIQARGGFLL
ncbi:hypothetical protein ASE01_07340 [Nocardioides sp. Root190]|uniref:hypothetical protein n=1 Tax=Nocardioides sp. Root190 TaxID=1736488 RepID=UPI0006FFD293|nr:hypothetical protein [Nocardioides sp. Root190]KRB77982.1 hypothetical protein ASE01_07340 [Nocardioides sp. Root190]